MDDPLDEPGTERSEPEAVTEEAPSPRPVRGIWWIFAPVPIGAALGAAWSSVLATVRNVDFSTPVLVGAGIGLAAGACLWAFFPYKSAPKKRTSSLDRGPS